MEAIVGTTEWELNYPQLRFEKVLDIFRSVNSSNLLDIGCGNGRLTKRIMGVMRVKSAFGVDLLGDRFDQPPGLTIYELDVDKETLPFGKESFDAVYCGELIEHLYDPDKLLDEIYRVLSPTGVCVLTTPNLASWPNRLLFLFGFQPYSTSVSLKHEGAGKFKGARVEGHRGHIRPFTLRALKDLLSLHRFKIVKLEGWGIGDLSIHLDSGILGRLVGTIDRCAAKFPSIASRLAVVIEREVVR